MVTTVWYLGNYTYNHVLRPFSSVFMGSEVCGKPCGKPQMSCAWDIVNAVNHVVCNPLVCMHIAKCPLISDTFCFQIYIVYVVLERKMHTIYNILYILWPKEQQILCTIQTAHSCRILAVYQCWLWPPHVCFTS